MSNLIDKSIKKAEKFAKFGDLAAAQSVVGELLVKYPGNPRAKALAVRIEQKSPKQIALFMGFDRKTIDELEFLTNSNQWMSLIQRCLELIEHDDGSPLVWNFLGIAQRAKGLPLLSEAAHRRAIELDPNFFAAYSNLGNVLKDLERFDEAIEVQKKSIELKPTEPKTSNNLGTLLEDIGRFDEAEKYFAKAVELDGNYATAKYNLGGIKLRKKEFVDGWAQREMRWWRDSPEQEPKLASAKPQWNGEPVDRLFVWSEQGVGDEIMFAGCYNELAKSCRQLTVSVSGRLLPIMQRSFPKNIKFIDRHLPLGDDEFDFQVPVLTALGHLRQNVESFQSQKSAYIMADKSKVKILRDELEKYANGKKIVGLSWFSKNATVGKKRSISLVELVSALPKDFFLVNLQYGEIANDMQAVEQQLKRGIASFGNVDIWNDIDTFVALIKSCDEIVSVDNSTVHFAGALNKKCHVLLPYSADWRWGLTGEKSSYWYGSLNLHWQSSLGDWGSSLQSLKGQY